LAVSFTRGIWTPREFPVVLLFSGKSGAQYGYRDGWTGEGVFQYTGEGQSGDMTFEVGNKAIRDHRLDHKDLLLFEDLGKGKGVRFEGVFECMGWSMVDGRSKREESRKLIVFDLVRVAAATSASPPTPAPSSTVASLPELREKAYDAAATSATGNGPGQPNKRGMRVANGCASTCLPGPMARARPAMPWRPSNVETARPI
jgi:5-methylcytosine-specific restriction enzyme A